MGSPRVRAGVGRTGGTFPLAVGTRRVLPGAIDCSAVSRFHEPQHPDFVRMNTSVGFDRHLWPQDIAQSRAHAKMLAAREIISVEDRDALLAWA